MKKAAALCPNPFSEISCSQAAYGLVLPLSSEDGRMPRLKDTDSDKSKLEK